MHLFATMPMVAIFMDDRKGRPYGENRGVGSSAIVVAGATIMSPVVHRFYLGSSVMRWWYRVFYPSVTAVAVTAPLSRGAKGCGGNTRREQAPALQPQKECVGSIGP